MTLTQARLAQYIIDTVNNIEVETQDELELAYTNVIKAEKVTDELVLAAVISELGL